MGQDITRWREPRLGLLVAAPAIALTVLTAAASPVAAEPPTSLDAPLTDTADVLTDEEEADVEAAIQELSSVRDIDFHVVFVDSFDGMGGPEWAIASFEESSLGYGDVVLAVAVVERRYGYHEDTSVTSDWASDIATTLVEPELRDQNWSGAALAAVEGYHEDQKDFPLGLFGAIWGVVLTAVSTPWLFFWRSRVRRRRQTEKDVLAQRQSLAQQVVALEEGLEKAQTEASFAEADLGQEESAILHQAAAKAHAVLGHSSTTLEGIPAERARRVARPSVLARHQDELRRTSTTVTQAADALTAAVERVRTARKLTEEPALVEELAGRISALRTQHSDVTQLVQAQAGDHPTWLHTRLVNLLDEGAKQQEAAQHTIDASAVLLDRGEAAEAGERWIAAQEQFHVAEATLARVGDPQAIRDEALAPLGPLRDKLASLIRTGQDQLEQHDKYRQSARTVNRQEEWSTRSPDELASVIAGAQDLIRRPTDLDVDPQEQAGRLTESTDSLTQAVQPYLHLADALRRAASSSSSRSSRSSRSRSSRSRSRSSSSRSSSRSSSSSSGGGRF